MKVVVQTSLTRDAVRLAVADMRCISGTGLEHASVFGTSALASGHVLALVDS